MNIDALIASDLKDLGARATRRPGTPADTGRALAAAMSRRDRSATRRRPILAGALAAGVAVFALPVPYREQTGWDATFRTPAGRAMTVHLPAASEAEAGRRARLLSRGTDVSLVPRNELVWRSMYAMARSKLFHIDVALKGKTDAEAEAEIRKQLGEQGWSAADVSVERTGEGTTVELGALDDEGRHLRMVRKDLGEPPERLELRPEPIDDAREPGMTDAQLREKILAQLRARGLDGEVTVVGDRVQIQVRKQKPD